jgi:ABC-2 type transport system ATP-binding protein
MLQVSGLTKTYGGVIAVRDVAFSAAPGEVVGLLGPNGSGKTTTLRMLTGLLTPTAGRVTWRGADVQPQILDYQSRLGYVPEEPKLYAYLTAPEYLELVGGLRGIARELLRARIDRYLELFRLDTDRYAPLSSFSKGMRQKVLIAAALVHDPEIVVLDEPCSGLDVASTLVLRTLVRTLAERGKVVIYSSHVLDMVEKVCSDVLILHRGRIVAHDSVQRLRELRHAASLEEVFAALAVDQDVDAVARDIAYVAAG